MSHGLLEILKYFLLALLWLFFVYAARMVLVEVRRSRSVVAQAQEIAPDPDLAHLQVLEPPPRRGERYDLGDELTLGRSPACLVSLAEDTFASAVHARIYQRAGDLFLEDLHSTNGTYLNEDAIDRPVQLHRGDKVRIGSTLFEVRR